MARSMTEEDLHGKGSSRSTRRPNLTALLLLLGLVFCSDAVAADVTWGSAYPLTVGVPTSVSLGGGSTVDLTVTTGGTQGLGFGGLGSAGSSETGLGYTSLTTLVIFNGGGGGSVTTTLLFSNFTPGPSHARGFVMVGAVDELTSAITLTSSVPGAVQTWSQVGTSFAVSPGNEDPIAWTPATGQITHGVGTEGIDSGGIVIDVGSIAQYGTITLTLDQALGDGIHYAFGEEVATPVPSMSAAVAIALSAALVAFGAVALNRRSAS